MRMIAGAVLILAAVQAFAHSLSVPFPNQLFAGEVLYPASLALAALGTGFVVWGAISEQSKATPGPNSEPAPDSVGPDE
ncbi:MAG: hypothetical protein ABGZ23_20950 [Fuerstiella sp.]|nr:hypothetical protein [Fuerstiella sp.]